MTPEIPKFTTRELIRMALMATVIFVGSSPTGCARLGEFIRDQGIIKLERPIEPCDDVECGFPEKQ